MAQGGLSGLDDGGDWRPYPPEALCAAVSALDISHAGSEVAPNVTLSLGVATKTPGPGERPGVLVRAADAALYQAKEQGRNRVALASS